MLDFQHPHPTCWDYKCASHAHGLAIPSFIHIFVSYKGNTLTLEDILFIIMCMYDMCALLCMYIRVCAHCASGGWRIIFKGQFSSSTVGSRNWTQTGSFRHKVLSPAAPSPWPNLDFPHLPLGSRSISFTHKEDRTELKEVAPLVKFF